MASDRSFALLLESCLVGPTFPHREAWQSSPMLAGVPWDEVVEAGRPVRRAWAEFARTGRVLDEGCPHLRVRS